MIIDLKNCYNPVTPKPASISPQTNYFQDFNPKSTITPSERSFKAIANPRSIQSDQRSRSSNCGPAYTNRPKEIYFLHQIQFPITTKRKESRERGRIPVTADDCGNLGRNLHEALEIPRKVRSCENPLSAAAKFREIGWEIKSYESWGNQTKRIESRFDIRKNLFLGEILGFSVGWFGIWGLGTRERGFFLLVWLQKSQAFYNFLYGNEFRKWVLVESSPVFIVPPKSQSNSLFSTLHVAVVDGRFGHLVGHTTHVLDFEFYDFVIGKAPTLAMDQVKWLTYSDPTKFVMEVAIVQVQSGRARISTIWVPCILPNWTWPIC